MHSNSQADAGATFDVVVIGAGAAGFFCAGIAGQRGLRVLLLDHARKVAEKIRISGGGRCNFTNRDAGPASFVSENPHFCRSALARYGPQDFLALLARHRIGWHEKHRGQLFCDDGSDRIIAMLRAEAAAGGVEHRQPCAVHDVRASQAGFELDTDGGTVRSRRLVVATGSLSVPAIGATDFGHRLARRLGHRVIEPRPALVPLTFDANAWAPFAALAGVSLEVEATAGEQRGAGARGRFTEDLLFTHRGLSGPAALQISTYWRPGETVRFDLLPGADFAAELAAAKQGSPRQLGSVLAERLPSRLAQLWLVQRQLDPKRTLPECRDRDLASLAQSLARWELVPAGTEGWKKAEVTAGGVDTRDLDSKTMESRLVPGLYFIGEVVDVTGWLGGYNFQWAWASAAACAGALAAACRAPQDSS